jgi:DNA-directed RNA polymerase subunit M/transcription elongation factor TFIIS
MSIKLKNLPRKARGDVVDVDAFVNGAPQIRVQPGCPKCDHDMAAYRQLQVGCTVAVFSKAGLATAGLVDVYSICRTAWLMLVAISQIRSADEPMTTFYCCVKCSHQWKDNG